MGNELWRPPDVRQESASDGSYRPSWSGATGYLNDEHAGIWHATEGLRGFQLPADSEKLYEMAYHCGAIILEIGMFAGRSAVVELRGALRAQTHHGKPRSQFFGVDIDPAAVSRTYQTLYRSNLADHAVLFRGNLAGFHVAFPITPTMVFVDGDHDYDGVCSDLHLLRSFLAAGTPVLCHDYTNPLYPGVTQAVDEWVRSGEYDWLGVFGCSALLRASSRCAGKVQGLEADAFGQARRAQLVRHLEFLEQSKAELEVHVKELSASRWRKLGATLGITKATTWEKRQAAVRAG
jgi:hypothetical protein